MNSEIKKYGAIRNAVHSNYVRPFMWLMLNRHVDIIFKNGLTTADEALFRGALEKRLFLKKEVRNILEVFRILIDAWKIGQIESRTTSSIARSFAMFLSLYVDGKRKRNHVTKGDFVMDTSTYIKEQIENPDLKNDFLQEIDRIFGVDFVEVELRNEKIETKKPESEYKYKEGGSQDASILILKLDGGKVLRYKLSRPSMNGEFTAYFMTELDEYFFCNCEVGSKGVRIITRTTVTKDRFDEA